MKKIQLSTLIIASVIAAASCKKEAVDSPAPVEQELITTVRLVVTNNSGFSKTFNYKVENGFGGGAGNTQIDDVSLSPSSTYNVEVQVWDESKTPAHNITEEVLAESNEHLFILQSNPATGPGSITFSNGNKDDAGRPLNQHVQFTTGAAGSGSLTVTLKHEPVNKDAATPAEAGGETDAEAIFPVVLQ